MTRIEMTMVLAAALLGTAAQAQQTPGLFAVGDRHQIVTSYETASKSENGSGSSRGGSSVEERVIAVHDDGVELEFDLPPSASEQDRAREWTLPARVLRQTDGSLRLLNRAELEARLESWLAAAKWTREICGRWIFTWNAFRIDCDPDGVLETIRSYDLLSADLRDGALYRVPEAQHARPLRQVAGGKGPNFTVILEVDPDAVRQARAESDVAVGEITGRPVSLEAALKKRAEESISGTIEVTFDTDSAGVVLRRTTVTRLEIVADGKRESETRTDIVERRAIKTPGKGK